MFGTMQFLLFICMMIVCAPVDWPPSPLGLSIAASASATAATTTLLLAAAAWIGRQARLRLVADPASRFETARQYSLARTYFPFVNLAGFAVELLLFGWGWAAQEIGQIDYDGRTIFVPGGELLVVAPYLIALIGSWSLFYTADRMFHETQADPSAHGPFWTRGGYLLFRFRQHLIFVFGPLLLMSAQQSLQRMHPELFKTEWLVVLTILAFPAILIVAPALLPPLLGLKPMPPGPIRDRLEANSRRLLFRYRRIYEWDTRGGMANAMIVGVIPQLRYVVFTDRLLAELNGPEIDAVFGHEVGHVKHSHMLYYGLFLLLSVILLAAIVQAIDEAAFLEYRTLWHIAPIVAMGIYMFAAFGFISRRCERQADLFGCRAGSCVDPDCSGHGPTTIYPNHGDGLCPTGIEQFVRALKKVEEINGMTREKISWRGLGLAGKLNWVFFLLTGWLSTWQHSTMPKRIAFLEEVARHPGVEERFQTRVWMVKCLVMLALVGALAALAWAQGPSILLAN